MKLHQEGTIYNLCQQSFPVVLDLEATDDGHLSGFVNFYSNQRPDGFPVGKKVSIITDDPQAQVVQNFIRLTIKFVNSQTAQVTGYIDGSRAQFQNANVQAELDDYFARMAIEEAKKSTPEDSEPRPKVGAVAVKHGQLLSKDCRTAVMSNGKMNGQHAEFRLTTRLSGAELDGATIYTTLEPCLNRNDPKVSCVDRLISVKVARVVIGALDPDHKGNGLRKLVHSPTIEIGFFPAALRAETRLLIEEHTEKLKKIVTNPERDALRERILEKKGKEVLWLNKKSNTHGTGTIVDCDEEVAILRCGTTDPFTYSLSELETSKQFMHGRLQFALVFKDR